MKIQRLLVLLFVLALPTAGLAAEVQPSNYWYKVVLQGPGGGSSFVGTSQFDPERMAVAVLATGSLIKLENLRILANTDGKAFRWQPDSEGVRVFIVPRNVINFFELAGDPMAKTDAGDDH